MNIPELKNIFSSCKETGKNCYATNSGHYDDFILGELSLVRDVKEKEIVLFRTFNNTTVVVKKEFLSKFNFHY